MRGYFVAYPALVAGLSLIALLFANDPVAPSACPGPSVPRSGQ